jgi:hypothetical protein
MRVPDEIQKCVVFLGTFVPTLSDKVGLSYIGTAFFIGIPSQTKSGVSYIYLVTAKHVAERLSLAYRDFEEKKSALAAEIKNLLFLRINTKNGKSEILKSESNKWFTHPTDKTVDIAVLPWAPPSEKYDYKWVGVDSLLSDEIIQKEGIGIGDEVFITGLFAHVRGSAKNIPIVRIGNIAMMSDEAIPTELGNIEAYLIEARSIGGLSGSPAFVRKTVPLGIGQFYLLGLMHGHWEIPVERKNDSLMADDMLGRVNMGIAIVVPAKKILEVLNHPDLVRMRELFDKDHLTKES